MAGTADNLDSVVSGIRKRALHARRFAFCLIALVTLTGIGTAAIFLYATYTTGSVYIDVQGTNNTITSGSGAIEWVSEITRAFIRVAAVIMSVFLINILVSFARYNLRAANFLDSRADCLVISGGHIEQIAILLPIISVDPLDFVNTPMNPYDTYLDAIRAILPGGTKMASGTHDISKS